MNRKSKIAIAIAAAVTVGATAVAAGFAHEREGGHKRWMQARGGYGMQGGGHRGGRFRYMLGTFDANGDGKLTQEEIDTVRAGQLKKFDKDGDGTLSLAEYEALWLDAMRERMVDRFQDHDGDGDGRVTQEEFGRRYANMIKFIDRNGDGVLDAKDMRNQHRGGEKNDD